jgi:type I restriction enzyme M protein
VDKEDAHARKGIFMIDASTGFMKDGPKNRLRAQDIHKIVDVFNKRIEVDKYSRMVPVEEIEKKDFNLNLPRYIDSQNPEDHQDIEGHLKGGIPASDIDALEKYWNVCPQLRQTLFTPLRPGYVALTVEKATIKSTIYEHPEFATFIKSMNCHFEVWQQKNAKTLRQLKIGFHPKEFIARFAEELLTHYSGKPLIDAYDVYQHLMDYWATTMQDDCYTIAADGWKAMPEPVTETKKGKDGKPDKTVVKGWTCYLVPKALIVARYYAKEQAAINQLTTDLENVTASITELEEENGGEEGTFYTFDKINKATVAARLKEINDDTEANGDVAVLTSWLKLNEQQGDLKKYLKDAEAALDANVYAHYPKLTEAEIKTLVVDDKWLATLDATIHGEMERISQALTQRVKELADRYETPIPQMVNRAAELEAKVNQHLKRMGFTWK